MAAIDKELFIKERSSFILSLFNVADMNELRIVHLLTEAYSEGYKQAIRDLKSQTPPLYRGDCDKLIDEINEVDKEDV